MSTLLFTNNASTVLASGINASVTSMTVATGTGALFPAPTGGQYCYITLSDVATNAVIEIVKCTARSGDTFTIVRGQDNTTAHSYLAGDKVELRVTAAGLLDMAQLDSANTFTQDQTLSNGTANGVAYLNGSKVVTSGTALVFDGTNLGIGTSSPASKLEVTGDIQQTWAVSMDRFVGSKFSTTYELGMHTLEATRETRIVSKAVDSSGLISFYTGVTPTERMRIDSSGNVGIGTNSPTGRLNIVSAAGTDNKLFMSGSTTAGSFAQFQNTSGSCYIGKDDSAGSSFGGTAYASVVYSSGAYPLEFYTNDSRKMVIDSTGNITIKQAGRATITTDNDLSFDLNAASNFKCTPTVGAALTFTNIASAANGQTGYVLLVNTGGYAITAAANTKVGASFLSTISAAGTYLVSYLCDGTNVYCTASGALS